MSLLTFLLFTALSLALLIALLRIEALRRAHRSEEWKDWNVLLTPRGQQAYEKMRHRMEDGLALADIALVQAAERHSFGSTAEAERFLEIGTRLIESHAPNMRHLLAGMAIFSRMVASMVPVTPLRPRDFELRQLVRLAQINRLFHHLLLTAGERFRFKIVILRSAFLVVARAFLRRSRQIRNDQDAPADVWAALESMRRDIHSLTDESLEMFRLLVLALTRAPVESAGALQDVPPNLW